MSADVIDISTARPAKEVILIPADRVDEFWPEFMPKFKRSSAGLGVPEAVLEGAEEHMRILAKQSQRQLWIIRGIPEAVITGGITNVAEGELGLTCYCWPVSNSPGCRDLWGDAGFVELAREVEAAARNAGCISLELRLAIPGVNAYGFKELPVFRKDLRGPMN
jgi:hypothetical protein